MSELVEIAILAYRNGRYRDASELLLQVTDAEPDNWLARLYLGMTYEKTGRVVDAQRLLKRMAAECPDDHLRVKAENALPLIEAEMRQRFQKQPLTSQMPKPAPKPVNPPSDDTFVLDDVAWMG